MVVVPFRRRRRRNTGRVRKAVQVVALLGLVAFVFTAFHMRSSGWTGDPMAAGPIHVGVVPPVPLDEQVKIGGLAPAPSPSAASGSSIPAANLAVGPLVAVSADSALTAVSGELFLVDLRGRSVQGLMQVKEPRAGTRLLSCVLVDKKSAAGASDDARPLFVAWRLALQTGSDSADLAATSPVVVACRVERASG